jgi:hypothetical protein
MATTAYRLSTLLWSSLLLICLLVASTDSTTIVKTHITTTKITVNEQHGVNVFESATTDSDPIAARSASGDPFASIEEENSDLELGKRIAQNDVPPPGQSAIGTGDTNPTSGISGSSEPESTAGSSSSVGSAKSSSQSLTEPESTLGSQDTHSSNIQNATGVSDSNTTSRLLTHSGSGETSHTGALPISNTTSVGTKPGNNTSSSSLIKLPSSSGQNTTMVATPSSGSKSSVAGTQIPISSIPSASSISATMLTSAIVSNESSQDTGNTDHTAATSSFSSDSRNVSITGTKTLSGNSSAVLSTTASPQDTQAASFTSAHNISSSISSTTARNSSTTGSGTSDIDSASLTVTPSLATTSDSSLQPSSISISDRRNFTALDSGKPRGPPSALTFSSSTNGIESSDNTTSTTMAGVFDISADQSSTGEETMPRSTTGPTSRPRPKSSTEGSTVPSSTDSTSTITATPFSSSILGNAVPQWVTLQTGEWRESALLMSCKAPCTLNLPPISLEPSAVLQYSAVTASICTHVGNQIYRFATTVSVDPVTITELTLDPVAVGTMTAGQLATTGEAGFQYPAGRVAWHFLLVSFAQGGLRIVLMAHAVLKLSWAAQICNAVALKELSEFHGISTQKRTLTFE